MVLRYGFYLALCALTVSSLFGPVTPGQWHRVPASQRHKTVHAHGRFAERYEVPKRLRKRVNDIGARQPPGNQHAPGTSPPSQGHHRAGTPDVLEQKAREYIRRHSPSEQHPWHERHVRETAAILNSHWYREMHEFSPERQAQWQDGEQLFAVALGKIRASPHLSQEDCLWSQRDMAIVRIKRLQDRLRNLEDGVRTPTTRSPPRSTERAKLKVEISEWTREKERLKVQLDALRA